jgi:hypothetical protein
MNPPSAFVFTFLSVIPERDMLRPLLLLFYCHSQRSAEPAFTFMRRSEAIYRPTS